ncbi:BEL1-like homeodomain protein 9 [Phoenix dactylifera]|uniref:BEL1-like homeodomain protein 9 n=1 Tax=Phoenix dactylifera TaxID=42345 RepID=A0A8B8J2L9_PHODC|nr:BEL1-like homeodomain protein 9 [Phoenix dactylifera]XP_026659253.2 BEL1-like homeodomain protein 9 [Phoenix dactylifera]
MSSAAKGYGGGDGEAEQLLYHYHHQTYHVPQYSRREKLRFPPEESPPPTSFFFHHDPNSLTTFLPSSSSSSSLSYYSPNPSDTFSPTTQFSGHQGFSLSLASSPSSSKPPPPSLPHLQFTAGPAPRPAGPFTGYAAVLNRSRFLEPARQILEEICDAGRRQGLSGGGGGMLLDADPPELSSLDHHKMEGLAGGEVEGRISGTEQQWKKTRLVSMLDEVYRKYKQYYQQVQAVITSFESVAGLRIAAPYASMALRTMLKHFRCLKKKISNQLSYANKVLRSTEGLSREESSSFGLISCGVGLQRAPNDSGTFGPANIWRPQRGLPERAVSVLRAWLFEHFLHPYPTDTDKQMLAKQTGLTRNQVSNWFINARVRLWKPMIEEIHTLDMRQLHRAPAADRNRKTEEQTQVPSASVAPPSSSQPLYASSSQKNQNPSTELFQDDLTHISSHIRESWNFVYDDLSGHQHGMDVAGGAKGDVSLTLGLHQNNGVCLAEPLPMNVVRRFGLEDYSDPYVMGAFEGQDRHFGKDTWRALPS